MSTSKGPYCPVWCVEVHPVKEVEDEFTIHWKGFGSIPGSRESLVRVWVAYEELNKYSTGAEVSALEVNFAVNLRALAMDCLEAAQWMEDNLQSIQDPTEVF